MDYTLYTVVAEALLQYTSNVLSSKSIAKYVLETAVTNSQGRLASMTPHSMLVLSHFFEHMELGDSVASTVLIGLKTLLSNSMVVDFPRQDAIYKSNSEFNTSTWVNAKKKHYANGFMYGKLLSDPLFHTNERDDSIVKQNIIAHRYEMIVIMHRAFGDPYLKFWELICMHYHPMEVVVIDGHDDPTSVSTIARYAPCANHFFSREGLTASTLADGTVVYGRDSAHTYKSPFLNGSLVQGTLYVCMYVWVS